MNLDELMQKYAEHLVNDYVQWGGKGEWKVEFEPGSRYTRVITVSHGSHRSAHSFIVNKDFDDWKQGDILKAASWKAPARNFARGNLNDPNSYTHIRWAGC